MKITIITVTFNAQAFLRETLDNVASFRSYYSDYLIIDGGSSDETVSLIKEYALKGIVTKWISGPDSGIYDAMNKGWDLAPGDSHIIYIGAGDKIIELPDVDIIDNAVILYGDVELEGRGVFRACADMRLKFGNTLHHQALLVPKALHPNRPFDCEFPTYADFDFNQRLQLYGVPFVRCSQLRGYAASGGVSHMLNVKEMTAVCRKNFGNILSGFAYIYLLVQDFKSRLRSGLR